MPALEPAEEKAKPMRESLMFLAAIRPLGLAARGAGPGERAVTAPARD
jgi:hypothetical protein